MLSYYDAWDEADRVQEQWKQQSRSRTATSGEAPSAPSSLQQQARDAASLMVLAHELHNADEEYDMFTDQLEWEAEVQKEAEKMKQEQASQCQFGQEVKQEIDESEKTEVDSVGPDLQDRIQHALLNALLQDALRERAAGDLRKHDEHVPIQESKPKSCPVRPPVKAAAPCTNEPKTVAPLPPLPPPKQPPPAPLPMPNEQRKDQERVRGPAGPAHEGYYYVTALVNFMYLFVYVFLFVWLKIIPACFLGACTVILRKCLDPVESMSAS